MRSAQMFLQARHQFDEVAGAEAGVELMLQYLLPAVAAGHTGAAGRDHDVDLGIGGPLRELADDGRNLVPDDSARGELVAIASQHLDQRIAGQKNGPMGQSACLANGDNGKPSLRRFGIISRSRTRWGNDIGFIAQALASIPTLVRTNGFCTGFLRRHVALELKAKGAKKPPSLSVFFRRLSFSGPNIRKVLLTRNGATPQSPSLVDSPFETHRIPTAIVSNRARRLDATHSQPIN